MGLACVLPEDVDCPLQQWDCGELARQLKAQGIVVEISASTVRRTLEKNRLKPWRVHHWLTRRAVLDTDYRERVLDLCDLYTRAPKPTERIFCFDEHTSIQPRPRVGATLPAEEGLVPVRVEYEYDRVGSLNLLAAFDIQTGQVYGLCRKRKRQLEVIELLELLEANTPASVQTIHVVCDNNRTHKGKLLQAWLAKHPRFRLHFPPVHCSWMNQVEQWFGIIKKKRLSWANFRDCQALESAIEGFIAHWNQTAHPFRWTKASFSKVLAKVDAALSRFVA